MYSDKVMDHFRNPRNVGEIADADGIGEVGNPVCGDMMTFYIKVKDNRLTDIKFKTFGCGAAIAVSSIVTEMGLGKTLEEAKKITRSDVAKELGGLPPNKMHCSNLGAEALVKAIEDYEKKRAGLSAEGGSASGGKAQPARGPCLCPFCKQEIKDEHDKICKPCGAKIDTNKT
ncbi:MAG: Fe-S cluster assembly scaffold protein NifU [Planctomycetota bacterium]